MAQLTMRYSRSASGKFTDLALQKPIGDLDRMYNGITLTRHIDSTKKVFNEIWTLDPRGSSIIIEKKGGSNIKFNLCSPNVTKLDISTIFKVSDSASGENVVKMYYIDPDQSKNVETYLSFDDEQTCLTFLKCIGYLMTKERLNDAHQRQIAHICKVFDSLDEDGNGFLTLTEMDKLFSKLNLKKKDKLFEYLYAKIAIESKSGMSTNEFIRFYHTITRMPDVEFIFATYALSNGSINVQQFVRFLKNEQREIRKPDEVIRLFKDLEVNVNAIKGCEFTMEGFMNYLFSETENSIRNPKHIAKPHLNDARPLFHYFVKSCFIYGTESTELYTEALKSGYRHFEVDLFGSEVHKSLVAASTKESANPVEFSEILQKVAQFVNDRKSDVYPIILTLKIHFSSKSHFKILANTLITKLEKKLLIFDKDQDEMPNLNQMFGKVLIRSSVKYATEQEGSHAAEGDILFSELIALDDNSVFIEENGIAPAESLKFSDIKRDRVNTTLSFNQLLFANLSNIDEGKALRTTSSYFVSVSPKSSFQTANPTLFYNFGVQSVVMPYSMKCLHSQLNDGFFEHNGNCGYVLKPDEFSEAAKQSEMTQENLNTESIDNMSFMTRFSQFPATDLIRVSITVICGRFMPDIKIKPYIHMELYGPNAMYGTTDIAESGGKDVFRISPRWNNSFEIELPVAVYRQSVLQISLVNNRMHKNEGNDERIGTCSIHISSLRTGFRNVPLVDEKGQSLYPTSILIHTKKNRSSGFNSNQSHLSTNHSQHDALMIANNEEAFQSIHQTR